MHPTAFLLGGLPLLFIAGTGVAQATLPQCAATCFESAVGNQTTCTPTDVPCICSSQPLNAAIQGCVMTTCTLKEALVAVNTTNAMCGIPIKDRTNYLIGVNFTFGIIAFLALGVRMLVSVQRHIFGADDLCAVVAFAFAAPVTAGQIACGYLGFGKDTWAVSAENIYKIMKIVYLNQLSYFISSTASKMCFLFMFLRVFPDARMRRFVYAGMGLSLLFSFAFGLPMVFACTPVSAVWTSWDKETPYKRCINQNVFWFVTAAYNIAVDVYIVSIPIPELLKLNLSTRKKLMIVAIFSTGIITIIVSIARLWALAQYGSSTNPIYDNMLSGIFSPLELNVGIVCMCMPAFRRFVGRFLPSCFDSSSKYREHREHEEGSPVPIARVSSGKRSGAKKNSIGASLLETTVKSVDTTKDNGEDELRLMELRRTNQGEYVSNPDKKKKGIRVRR